MQEDTSTSRAHTGRRRGLHPLLVFGLCLGLIPLVPGTLQGQGTLEVMRTSGGESLYSGSVPIAFPSVPGGNDLEFKFGFETDETFAPGKIFDSFSLTLQNGDGSITLVLLTSDASGVTLAPATPGTTLILPAALAVVPIAPPTLDPNLSRQAAFQVHAHLPESVRGQSTTLYLDLFSNRDGVDSLGWFSDPVLVPEPCVGFAATIGLTLLALCSRRRSRHD